MVALCMYVTATSFDLVKNIALAALIVVFILFVLCAVCFVLSRVLYRKWQIIINLKDVLFKN